MIIACIVSILVSCCGMVLLCRHDSNRHKQNRPRLVLPRSVKIVLVSLTLTPLLVLPWLGHFTALLVWMGSITILGWLLAVLPTRWV